MIGHIFYTLDHTKTMTFINLLAILDIYKGSGLAKTLVDLVIKQSKVLDFKSIELIVNIKNHRAINFYKRLGFEYYKRYDRTNHRYILDI
jgi:ribosomal protein S18 acetylase RimI-like enzyme